MSVFVDVAGYETAALFAFSGDLKGKRVLEIGCGNGRLTRLYAHEAGSVLAIDPDEARIAAAREKLVPDRDDHVCFMAASLQELETVEQFDLAILSWSL